jgi:hypothetical protein
VCTPNGTLICSAETTKSRRVQQQVLELVLEPLVKMVDELVEVFSTKVGATSSSLDLEKTSLIVRSGLSLKKKNENVFLTGKLLVKTEHSDGGGRLIGDAKDEVT